MIYFVDNNGTVISSLPSPVYQGSADTNNIYLIAPFASNLQFTVAFELPNGLYTESYIMTPAAQLPDVQLTPENLPYSIWTFSLPNEITEYYGTVYAQFYAYGTNGQITASSRTSFVVSKGVPVQLPSVPTQDIYNQILTALSQYSTQLNSGAYAARAIYWWINTYTYGINEITYYPVGTYGAFIKSVTTNNTNNQPYNAQGVINSSYWEELVNFNTLYEASQNAVESAQNAATSEQNAAASEQAAAASQAAAAQSESNAAESEQNAAQSENSAAQSATSAAASELAAANSAVAAENSATAAAESAQTVTDYLGKTTVFVNTLPETGDPSYLYFVTGEANNLFSIYIWDGQWELLGESNLVINNTGEILAALPASGWADNAQTVAVQGLTTEDNVSTYPASGYGDDFINYGIKSAQIVNGGVQFTCTSVPPASVAVIISITKNQGIPTATGYYTKPQVDTLISDEASAREQADNTLQANITAEQTAREQAVQSLQQSITNEANTRAQADTTLQNNIDAEQTARQQAVSSLQQSLSNETTARENADSTLQSNINAEQSARESADNTLQSNINSEASTRAAADTSLGNQISDIVDGTTAVGKASADGNGNNIVNTYATQTALNNSLAAKQNVTDNSLTTTSKTVVGAINENAAAIEGLRQDWIAQDHFKGFAATATDVQEISGDLNDFVYCIGTGTIWTYGASGWVNSNEPYPSDATPLSTTAPLMDGTASAGSSTSAARADHIHPTDTSRASASALTAETQARQNADTQLQSNIDSEASAREQADNQLQTAINNVGVNTPVQNAQNVTQQINGVDISTIFEENGSTVKNATYAASAGSANDPNAVHFNTQTLTNDQQTQARTNIGAASQTALTAETNNRTNADTTLQNNISAEATARENADSSLQTAIDNEASTRASADSNLQTAINAKYTKPSTGIPASDLSQNVQNSLDNAGNAYSSSNPPPYPVTSVNGQTGAVTIPAAGEQTTSGGFQGGIDASAGRGAAIGNAASASYGGAVGYEASAELGGAVGNQASATTGGAVGAGASASTGGAVGLQADAGPGGAVGNQASATSGFAGGYLARATAANAVQLGQGTNNNADTLQFRDYQIVDANGNIPAERLSNAATPEQVNSVSMAPAAYANRVDIAITSSPMTYTAPANGYLQFQFHTSNGQYVNAQNRTSGLYVTQTFTSGYPNMYIPARKGDSLWFSFTASMDKIYFIPAISV